VEPRGTDTLLRAGWDGSPIDYVLDPLARPREAICPRQPPRDVEVRQGCATTDASAASACRIGSTNGSTAAGRAAGGSSSGQAARRPARSWCSSIMEDNWSPMATLNVKNMPDALYRKLQARARRQRRSVAQEVTHILAEALETPKALSILELKGLGKDLWAGVRASEHVARERDGWD
jgi:plasmid stability protein